MARPLRSLIIEDSERDEALLVRELRRGGYDLTHRRVDTRETLVSALEGEGWDIAISDYSMPRFNALDALAVIQRKTPDLPVIIVSGTIGEEAAVSALRAGARDFIVKGRFARLLPAIDRELGEAALRAERRRVSEELAQFSEMFSGAIESISEGFAIYDRDDRLVRMNSHFRSLFAGPIGRDPIGTTFEELIRLEMKHGHYRLAADQDQEAFIQEQLATHRKPGMSLIYKIADGRWLRARDYPMPDGSIIAVRTDVTELVESEEKFRTLADNLPGIVFRQTLSAEGEIRDRYVSPSVQSALGVDAEEFISGRARLLDFIHPDDREKKLQGLRDSAVSLKPFTVELRRTAKPDDEVRWWQISATPRRLGDGTVEFDGIALDVTDRRTAEDQLRQALKMEAIGQLTGGIAHDFNNLLTIIIGNAERLEEQLAAGSPEPSRMLKNIIGAGDHAAALTRRLLAFARKEAPEPRVVNINEFVVGMKPLLQRSLGENIDIEMRLGSELWDALVDPHQIEAAVLNLAINARDAMQEGGHLTIETANTVLDDERAAGYGKIAPGEYVSLSVTDDGCGMSPEVLARVLEPFFTTKPIGKGTGLGLSMVHGFVKQSGGHMTIYSEVGRGSTFRLYFPRAQQAGAGKNPADLPSRELVGGHETVLVVEDEPAVRESTTTLLKNLGYAVLEARNGPEAIAIADGAATIDLLFTDMIMPGGMTGKALAEELAKRRPGLRVLYCSGYTESAIGHQGRLEEGFSLLQKPYRRRDLARKVREVLDEPAR